MFSSLFNSSSTPTPPISRPLTPIEGNSLPKTSLNLEKGESDLQIFNKQCPFEKHGCDFVGNRLKIQEHMRDQNDVHITLIGEKLQPFRDEIIQGIEVLEDQLDEAEELLILGSRVRHCFSHSFLWHIEEYPAKYRSAKKVKEFCFESPKFLSHRFGYSMMASMAPFGELETSREYASIYITIIPSEHDAILEWPFTSTIVFTLYDQKESNHLITKLIPQISDENASSFDRPKEAPNAKFGLKKFVKISEMQEGKGFVQNDQIFIGIDFE